MDTFILGCFVFSLLAFIVSVATFYLLLFKFHKKIRKERAWNIQRLLQSYGVNSDDATTIAIRIVNHNLED